MRRHRGDRDDKRGLSWVSDMIAADAAEAEAVFAACVERRVMVATAEIVHGRHDRGGHHRSSRFVGGPRAWLCHILEPREGRDARRRQGDATRPRSGFRETALAMAQGALRRSRATVRRGHGHRRSRRRLDRKTGGLVWFGLAARADPPLPARSCSTTEAAIHPHRDGTSRPLDAAGGGAKPAVRT